MYKAVVGAVARWRSGNNEQQLQQSVTHGTIVFIVDPSTNQHAATCLLRDLKYYNNVDGTVVHGFNLNDLMQHDVQVMQDLIKILKSVDNVRIVVGGNNQSLKTVLDVLSEFDYQDYVPIAPLSLNGENSLGYITGWGRNLKWSLENCSREVLRGQVCLIDTWNVKIEYNGDNNMLLAANMQRNLDDFDEKKQHLEIPLEGLHMKMVQYFSCGFDASIITNSNDLQTMNSKDFMTKSSTLQGKNIDSDKISVPLHEAVKVILDGEECQLPECEGVLTVFNIHSFSGMANIWQKDSKDSKVTYRKPLVNDGLLEIGFMYSKKSLLSLHSSARAVRIGQGERIRLEFLHPTSIQVDGKPWILPSGTCMSFSYADHFRVVAGPRKLINF